MNIGAAGLVSGVLLAAPALASPTVFACGPEWAALTRILLPQARIHVATHAQQDPHHIEARPALIAQLRGADVAICTGAGLEEGWLPVLQQRAGNPKVQDGSLGMFYAASTVTLLDPRPGQGGHPFAGDIHPQGNPHLHADPRRILDVARAWSSRLQQLLPAAKQDIERRLAAFESSWTHRLQAWQTRSLPLRGMTVAAQHGTFLYLWDWLGVRQVADLEPKPGLSPTPGHLQRLLGQLRAHPPRAIVISSYHDPRSARWLAQQLGERTTVVQLPATVEDPTVEDALGRWMDRILSLLGPA
ncbi:MAG: metal ABC transporter solute-binding protein, Zn/Mn family [Limnohabitans sp.]